MKKFAGQIIFRKIALEISMIKRGDIINNKVLIIIPQ